jgi:hypothetical protein
MASLELTNDQTAILKAYLERALSDLSSEISDTDDRDYRHALKSERRLLQEIVEQLAGLGGA